MKFWEVLKAVDEGKTVEYRNDEGTWSPQPFTDVISKKGASQFEWRIKPEPRVFYILKNTKSGFVYGYNSEVEMLSVLKTAAYPEQWEQIKVVEQL